MSGKQSSSIMAKSGSDMTNFILTTVAAALVASISAYCVSSWKREKRSKEDTESVLLEQLKEIRKRLNDLEYSKKKTRRLTRSSLSFRADEREYSEIVHLLFSCHMI